MNSKLILNLLILILCIHISSSWRMVPENLQNTFQTGNVVNIQKNITAKNIMQVGDSFIENLSHPSILSNNGNIFVFREQHGSFVVADKNLNKLSTITFTLHLGINLYVTGKALSQDNNTIFILYNYYTNNNMNVTTYLAKCSLNAILVHCSSSFEISQGAASTSLYLLVDQNNNVFFSQNFEHHTTVYSVSGKDLKFNWKQNFNVSIYNQAAYPPNLAFTDSGTLVYVFSQIDIYTNFSSLLLSQINSQTGQTLSTLNITDKVSSKQGFHNVQNVVSIKNSIAYFCNSNYPNFFPSTCFGVNLQTNSVLFSLPIQSNYSQISGIDIDGNLIITSSYIGYSRSTQSVNPATQKINWSLDFGTPIGEFLSIDGNGVLFFSSCSYQNIFGIKNGNFVANITIPNMMCPDSYTNPIISDDGSLYIAIPGGRHAPGYIVRFD